MGMSAGAHREPKASILGQLLAVQNVLHVLPSPEKMGQFISQALNSSLPECSSSLCIRGQAGPVGDVAGRQCAACPAAKERAPESPPYDCRLAVDDGVRAYPLATVDGFYGHLLVAAEKPEALEPYEPFLINLANAIALSLENKWQRRQLELQTEKALRESEYRYRSLFEAMLNGVAHCKMVFDEHGKPVDWVYLDVNEAFERITGLKKGMVLGKRVTEATPKLREDAPELFEIYGKVASTGEKASFDVYLDSLQMWLSVRAHSPKRGHLVAVFDDITERKRAEKEREQLIATLESQNSELERFAYTVSHDLKSPLITINGYAGMLREDLAEGHSEQIQNDLDRISTAATRMEDLLNDVLELSRVGRLINPPEQVRLEDLVNESLELVAGQIKRRGVTVAVSPDLPTLYGDSPRLLEVVQNLIENAVKYMGSQPRPRIEIGVRSENDVDVCYVRDNGIGIEPQYHDQVFGLFNKLDKTSEGSGIGLAIVKRIIDVHGGRIWVESEGPGKGSTFCFTLPPKGEAGAAATAVLASFAATGSRD